MSTNIEMNILQSNNQYEILYPKTLGSLVNGKVSSASTADSASIATSASSADTLSSTLPVAKGGTGVTSISSLKSKLNYKVSFITEKIDYTGNGSMFNYLSSSYAGWDSTIIGSAFLTAGYKSSAGAGVQYQVSITGGSGIPQMLVANNFVINRSLMKSGSGIVETEYPLAGGSISVNGHQIELATLNVDAQKVFNNSGTLYYFTINWLYIS